MQRLPRTDLAPRENTYSHSNPSLLVEEGEVFIVETVNSGQPVIRSEDDVKKPFYKRQLSGPIYVNGVKPGDSLIIEILEINPVGHARSRVVAKSGDHFETVRHCFLEIIAGKCLFPGVGATPLRPMIGEINVIPADVSAGNPGDHGGNMDVSLISAGNILHLRAQCEGGLLLIGDLHAIMGEGEILGIAAEMAGEVALRIKRNNSLSLERPAVFYRDQVAFIASHVCRREAIRIALEDATSFVQRYSQANEEEARLYVIDTADLHNGGVFLEESLTEINRQIRTVWLEVSIATLQGFSPLETISY